MNTSSENTAGIEPGKLHTREVHLQKLEAYCRALALTLTRAGLRPTKALEALQYGAAGACARCGACVTGEDLAALSQPATPDSSATVRRLRLGDCSHPGCKSFFYRLSFQNLAGIDWRLILPQVEGINEEIGKAEALTTKAQKRAVKLRLTARIALGLGIFLALFVIRQIYYGGRIPLLREPEKFKVDPGPPGWEEHH